MAGSRAIRSRSSKKRIKKSFDLQLTSMLDILVIILVFLLKSYSTSTNNFTTPPELKAPYSSSQDLPPDSLHLVVTPVFMSFEDKHLIDFSINGYTPTDIEVRTQFSPTDLADEGRKIIPLYDALVAAREQSELLRAQSKVRDADGKPLPFDGVLAVQADKRIQYEVVKKILYTAQTAGYKMIRFLALRREE